MDMAVDQESAEGEVCGNGGGEPRPPRGAKPLPFHRLLGYADAVDWLLMALGTLGAVVHGMAQPVGYLLLGKALDAFGRNINNREAMVTALYKVLPFVWYMAIATLPAGMLEISCWMYASERQSARLRLEFLRAVLRQDIAAFDTDLNPGKVITGVTNHMNIIQDAIGEKLGHFISCFSTFFAGIVIAFICSWEVALLALLVVPLITAVGAIYTKKMNAISALKMIHLCEATSIVEQTISQIKTVFSFVGEMAAIKSFAGCMEKQFIISKQEAMIKGLGMGAFQTVTFCSWAFIVWFGAVVVSKHRATGGETLAAVMSILFGAISITYAAPDIQIFNQAKAAGSEVFRVIERKPSISYETKGEILEGIEGHIDVQGVYFSYPSREEMLVLRGFTLSIPAGKVVALVGSSGCGKSTVISLVQRFYDPSIGEIFVDGHNIKNLDLKFLRRNIGAVSQEPSLFVGTIKDNLSIGNQNASHEDIIRAASTANAHSFIAQLPEQYLTEVGERGVQLSGGQKQRIAIARAILKDPPILLLDEATSALDSESEKLVQDALENAMNGRTVILIAHRMSTVINADVIAVVENGEVRETGTHSELLRASEAYQKLFDMQNLTTEPEQRETYHAGEAVNASPRSCTQSSDFSEQQMEQIEERTKFRENTAGAVQEMKKKEVSFFRIWYQLNKVQVAKAAVGSFAAALSGISKPVFGYFIITIGVAYYDPDAIRKVEWYSMMFSLIGLLALVTHTLQHYFYGIVGETAMKNLRKALFTAVLRNEIAWFERTENGVGFLTSKIVGNTSMIKTIISDRMSIIVQCVSSIVIATTVSLVVNWRMALVAWAVMPCHFIGGLVQAKSAKGFSGDSAATHREIVALASECASNIRTVASFTYEEQSLQKAKLSLKNPVNKMRKESIKYGIFQGISLCLWNVAHAVALWYTTVLVKKQQASFRDGIRAYQIFSLTVPSITELWTLIPTVVSAIRILTPSFQMLDRKTEIDPDIPEVSGPQRINGKIEFKRVIFSYPLRPEVQILSGFNMSVDSGQKIALVGPSGAGKSSVLGLLLRFYDPCGGRILIDQREIKHYNLRCLRAQIGFVQQEPLLFSSSIRDNICYGNEGSSEAEIVEAATEAKVHEFVSNLPNGYDTLVGEKGCQLSGGQKQRIAVARVLLKKPAILLLDEATSALDGESERAVISAISSVGWKMSGGMLGRSTHLTVAHRLSSVMDSDIILAMDKGHVVEMGDHPTLIAKGGLYSRLFHLQTAKEEAK